ncbi:MAG: hypothetical protein WD034_03825 [Parvibaculum sp.]
MRFLFNLALFLLALPILFMLAYQRGFLDDYVPDEAIDPEPFIQAELANVTDGADLSRRIDSALDEKRHDDAVMYAEIAGYMDVEIDEGTRTRLLDEDAPTRRAVRGAGNFLEGFVTGQGSDTAGFMGAIASDLTVVGDVRDIGVEGSKLARGEDYSKLILGLSVVGLAATTATVATGGGGLPVKVGVSLLKVAEKAGTITARFARDVSNVLQEAVNFEKLRGLLRTTDLTDSAATRRAILDYADGVSMARVTPILTDMAALERAVGPAEAVRLMKHVDSTGDLARVGRMGEKLGAKTRGVIGLTGKTSLRAFKTAWNLILMALQWVWAIVAGLGALFLGSLSRRAVRRRRNPA